MVGNSGIGCHAFIDDSGDVGTRQGSQDHFVLGGYLVTPQCESDIESALLVARKEFGFPPSQSLHFRDLSHERRVRVAQIVNTLPIDSFAAVLCKRAGPIKRPWAPAHLYHWMIRLVLERVSWYCREVDLKGSITFAHLKGQKVDKSHDYLNLLQESDTNIDWAYLHLPIRFSSPETDQRLQVADAIASSTGAAFQGGNHGICEPRYLYEMKDSLWRRKGRLQSYGLKIQPPLHQLPKCPTDHDWLIEKPI